MSATGSRESAAEQSVDDEDRRFRARVLSAICAATAFIVIVVVIANLARRDEIFIGTLLLFAGCVGGLLGVRLGRIRAGWLLFIGFAFTGVCASVLLGGAVVGAMGFGFFVLVFAAGRMISPRWAV